mmetsp:Transcript_59926/g.178326  ORF Transcript_59926/g.178326 Transcript_59926/m.178326 type:complete len:238 (-) Transcript_59926:510-1223(-)
MTMDRALCEALLRSLCHGTSGTSRYPSVLSDTTRMLYVFLKRPFSAMTHLTHPSDARTSAVSPTWKMVAVTSSSLGLRRAARAAICSGVRAAGGGGGLGGGNGGASFDSSRRPSAGMFLKATFPVGMRMSYVSGASPGPKMMQRIQEPERLPLVLITSAWAPASKLGVRFLTLRIPLAGMFSKSRWPGGDGVPTRMLYVSGLEPLLKTVHLVHDPSLGPPCTRTRPSSPASNFSTTA